jgi:hypothetical protein
MMERTVNRMWNFARKQGRALAADVDSSTILGAFGSLPFRLIHYPILNLLCSLRLQFVVVVVFVG